MPSLFSFIGVDNMNNNYADDFLNLLEKDSVDIILNDKDINSLKAEILNWLNIKNQYDRGLENALNNIEREKQKTIAGITELFKTYDSMHRDIMEIGNINKIVEHYKNGLRIIDKISKTFTGQGFTFSILYVDKNQKLYERKFTLEELLPLLGLTVNKANLDKNKQNISNTMSLYVSSSKLAQAAITAIDKDKSEIEKMISAIQRPSLWESLLKYRNVRYGLIPIFKGPKNYKGTLSNVYTVYMDLVNTDRGGYFSYIGHRQGQQNTYGLAGTLLDEVVHQSTDLRKTGSYQLEQLKVLLTKTSTQKIASVQSIDIQMQKIYEALQSSSKNELVNNIKKIFTPVKNQINSSIEKEGKEKVIEEADKIFQKNGFDIR